MRLFTAIWNDGHSDTTAHIFSDREKAIAWAKAKAKESAWAETDYEEEQIEGWEFYASYSCEGDCIYVVETELDKEI